MKNKFYKYFFQEFLSLLTLIILSLACVVWAVQAVNFLDLVTEGGHSFGLYFSYTILGLPKIIARLLPFSFLIALIITIIKFEKDNELIILWTSGLNKIKIVNLILLISIIITLFQLIVSSTISPQALFMSRGIIKNSDLSFFPSLVKEKKFNDTVKGLTIFVESKKNNDLENIFLRDDSESPRSSTIIAKSGYVIKKGGYDFLILFDGIVQKEKGKKHKYEDNTISTINFTKTEINLSKYAAHTITHPKIQERTSTALLACLIKFTTSILPNFNLNDWASENCYYWTDEEDMKRNTNEYFNELNRRFILPFYIPLIGLICCFLLSSKRERKNSLLRLFCFLAGLLIIIFAEISLRSADNSKTLLYIFYIFPLAFGILNYLILLKIFAFESLKER